VAISLSPLVEAQSTNGPGTAFNTETCDAVWIGVSSGAASTDQASPYLSADQASTYFFDVSKVDTDNDGKVTKDEFQTGCEGGWLKAQPQFDMARPFQCPAGTCFSNNPFPGCYRC